MDELTDKDKQLIAIAERFSVAQIDEVGRLQNLAETEEAKRRLHRIWVTLYHKEEYEAGHL